MAYCRTTRLNDCDDIETAAEKEMVSQAGIYVKCPRPTLRMQAKSIHHPRRRVSRRYGRYVQRGGRVGRWPRRTDGRSAHARFGRRVAAARQKVKSQSQSICRGDAQPICRCWQMLGLRAGLGPERVEGGHNTVRGEHTHTRRMYGADTRARVSPASVC